MNTHDPNESENRNRETKPGEEPTGEQQPSEAPPSDKGDAVKKKRRIEVLVFVIVAAAAVVVLSIQIPKIIDWFPPEPPSVGEQSPRQEAFEWLELTEEQMTKRDELIEQFEGEMRSPEFRAAFEEILTPEQRERLNEQRDRGGRGRMTAQIIESLNLTEQQEQQRAELENRLEDGMRNPDFRPEFEKMLTDEQKETFRTGLEEARRESGGPSSHRSEPERDSEQQSNVE